MQSVVASAGILNVLAHQVVQTKDIVELAKQQQPTVGADLGAVEPEADTAVKTEPAISLEELVSKFIFKK